MAEKFQEKVAGIINKHDIVLNNLKEEHSSTLEDLANNNLTLYAPIPQNSQTHWNNLSKPTNCLSLFDHFVGSAHKGLRGIAVLRSKLVLAKSFQMKYKKAFEDKLHDVSSKHTERQSFHNEAVEKYDQNKEEFEKDISVLTLEKEQLVNTVNDHKKIIWISDWSTLKSKPNLK